MRAGGLPRLTAVVAATENHVIGRDNGMPWHLPADLAHFKAVTLGHPVLMGRRTFEAIGRPLPGRRNLVLSRNASWAAQGVEVVQSLDAAIDAVAAGAAASGDTPELMIIGGATLYALALPRTQRVHLTRLHMQVDGDAHFPPLPESAWRVAAQSARRPADARNACDMTFFVMERRG